MQEIFIHRLRQPNGSSARTFQSVAIRVAFPELESHTDRIPVKRGSRGALLHRRFLPIFLPLPSLLVLYLLQPAFPSFPVSTSSPSSPPPPPSPPLVSKVSKDTTFSPKTPMFLTERSTFHLPFPLFPSKNSPPSAVPSLPFDQALTDRLHSLLPIPASSSSIPLSWLCRAVDVLALTLSDAAALISDPRLSGSDRGALAAHLDSGMSLLDSCNAVAAHIDLLLRRRLLLRFALHLLSSPASLRRARDAIAEWDRDRSPRRAIHDSATVLVRSLAPGDPPRGKISAVRRAMYAVEAVSRLVVGAVIAVLGGGDKGYLDGISVSGEFPWAEAFNKVAAAVSGALGEGFAGEVEAAEASVRRLAIVIDGDDDGEKTEKLRSAVKDAERATDEMTDGLDRLSNAVNGLFRAALCTREAALRRFRSGLQGCK